VTWHFKAHGCTPTPENMLEMKPRNELVRTK
jgi:hypothetical protein